MNAKHEISQKYSNQAMLRLNSTSYNPEHVLIAAVRLSFADYLRYAQADFAMAQVLDTCQDFRKQLTVNQNEMHRVLNNEVSAQELLSAWVAMPELPSEDEIYQGVS
jgi:hypothetical protein